MSDANVHIDVKELDRFFHFAILVSGFEIGSPGYDTFIEIQ